VDRTGRLVAQLDCGPFADDLAALLAALEGE
jgi:hypothetical protein